MTRFEMLDDMLRDNGGYIKMSDAAQNGVTRTSFFEYVKARGLHRAAKGLYISQDAWPDGMYEIQSRYPSAVFSHETALYLHDMAVREPLQYTITLRTGAGATRLTKENIKVYSVQESLLDIGLAEGVSPAGHKLRVYNKERTICDILRSRRNIEIQTLNSAIKEYAYAEDSNIPLLMRYAKLFSIEKIASQYMEMFQNG